jgi:hypothetical protein
VILTLTNIKNYTKNVLKEPKYSIEFKKSLTLTWDIELKKKY